MSRHMTPAACEMREAILEVARDLDLHDDDVREAVSAALRDIERDMEMAAEYAIERADALYHARMEA